MKFMLLALLAAVVGTSIASPVPDKRADILSDLNLLSDSGDDSSSNGSTGGPLMYCGKWCFGLEGSLFVGQLGIGI
ncbi:hypothetical protein VTN00DRAFT_73 [Thermoascus crustaceus]|uniref:uncharacterized protein n=1 Tax=Thermoascus crustaceus TaxID=5088 RepID=UPI003743AB4F